MHQRQRLIPTKKRGRNWPLFGFVPLTGHFSNPFFENVDELLALRDSLEEEGLIARLTELPGVAEKGPNTPIPYRP